MCIPKDNHCNYSNYVIVEDLDKCNVKMRESNIK